MVAVSSKKVKRSMVDDAVEKVPSAAKQLSKAQFGSSDGVIALPNEVRGGKAVVSPPVSPKAAESSRGSSCLANQTAERALHKLMRDSTFFKEHSTSSNPPLRRLRNDEVEVDHDAVLGKGGFAVVSKGKIAGDVTTYAFKQIRPELSKKRPLQYANGAADLSMEGAFLERLRGHPHIVNLVGIASERDFDTESASETFFLVLEQLQGTLEGRLKEWHQADAKLRSNTGKRLAAMKERLVVATQIAETVAFLHSQNVLYRDLKSENVGFGLDGTVKIFDFGLCKEIKSPKENGKYSLTGNTGSKRYMAPEVAKNWAYGFPVDVYSFSILLWEMVACKRAFPHYNADDFQFHVVQGEERPPMEEWWPVELQWLLKKGWSFFANTRPDMNMVVETLKEIVEDIDEELVKNGGNSPKAFRFGSNFGRSNHNSERSHKKSSGRDEEKENQRQVRSHRPPLKKTDSGRKLRRFQENTLSEPGRGLRGRNKEGHEGGGGFFGFGLFAKHHEEALRQIQKDEEDCEKD